MMERFTEHRASSFNDAGLWRMLLEKAKKGTTTESYFVADIVEESLQTSMFAKLGLPAEFLERHRKNLTENIILEGPDGHKWPVMLGQSWDSKPCLLHGWREFATDCNLAVNDQILFFLFEDSHFLVQVFDSNLNIKRGDVGTSAPTAKTTLPQVTDPFQSFGFKTPRPSTFSLPSRNDNDSGVAKNVHKESHTTRASPSGEKLGNQEPGVEEDDGRVADFNAHSGAMVETFPDPESPPPSAVEEDQALSMERARNLNQETTDLDKGGPYDPAFDPPQGSTLTVYDDFLKVTASAQETARSPDGKGKEAEEFIEEKIPEKRARQAPTDRSQAVFASTSKRLRARGMKKTSPDNSDDSGSETPMSAPEAPKSAPAKWNRLTQRKFGGAATKAARAAFLADLARAREATKAAANKEGEARASAPVPASDPVTPFVADLARAREAAKAAANKAGEARARARAPAPASDPVTPLLVEASKQAFKRPQPRNPLPRQLYFSKRRPVTLQERQAALEAGQRYAAASYNRTHVMQLRVSQVYCGNLLGGTQDFALAMELPLQGHKQVTLFDLTGRQWDALWRAEHPKRTGLVSDGWTSFVLDHFLEEGDVCVFELPDPKVSNICVTVFRVVPLTPTPSRWRDHYSLDAPVVPAVVPAVVQPEADLSLDQATLEQSSSFEKEDSGMEGKRRRLSINLNLGSEEEMNKSCEDDKSNKKDKSSEKEKRCMEEKSHEEPFCVVDKIVEEKI